jgi:hypothetical protein
MRKATASCHPSSICFAAGQIPYRKLYTASRQIQNIENENYRQGLAEYLAAAMARLGDSKQKKRDFSHCIYLPAG